MTQAAAPEPLLEQTPAQYLACARQTLQTEAEAILDLIPRLDHQFVAAMQLILNSKGRLIVSGIGKSGHIARKIASTLSSTGTPAYFLHPAEASHGDLGMITSDDILLALSNSGESEELVFIVPIVKRMGGKLIAFTGNPESSLATAADIHLYAGADREACPLNLAPTASTTAALALGDALAVALLTAKGFGTEDFARSHPGGALGRRLLTHVRDIMREATLMPIVHPSLRLTDAILAMSKSGLGLVAITHEQGKVCGIFTDGDLRRTFERQIDLQNVCIGDVMNPHPVTIGPDRLAVEAVEMMERHRISALLVVSAGDQLLGALNMHDLFKAKVI